MIEMKTKFDQNKLKFVEFVPIKEYELEFFKEKVKKLENLTKRSIFDVKRGEYLVNSKIINYNPTQVDFTKNMRKSLSL